MKNFYTNRHFNFIECFSNKQETEYRKRFNPTQSVQSNLSSGLRQKEPSFSGAVHISDNKASVVDKPGSRTQTHNTNAKNSILEPISNTTEIDVLN